MKTEQAVGAVVAERNALCAERGAEFDTMTISHLRPREKIGRLQPEGTCNSCDVFKRNIFLSSLDLPDIRSVQIADLCEVLLR